MSTEPNRPSSYSDLGETWLRDQKARILQRHLQFGRHLWLDVDSLVSRAAKFDSEGNAFVIVAGELDEQRNQRQRFIDKCGKFVSDANISKDPERPCVGDGIGLSPTSSDRHAAQPSSAPSLCVAHLDSITPS